MKILYTEGMSELLFCIISMRHIDNVIFHILVYHKPRTTAQSQSFTLANGMKPVSAVLSDNLSGFQFYDRSRTFSQETADTINQTKAKGGRVICVGTTSCRTIESWAGEDGTLKESAGWTSIFIYPGYRFRVLDGLVTNFHLPESTLIMLVSALAGRKHVLAAYEEAVREKYRFFSFGDAMFIH